MAVKREKERDKNKFKRRKMEKRDSGMRGKCSKQGGEARIERYLEDGDGNDGPKMTLGRNWDT